MTVLETNSLVSYITVHLFFVSFVAVISCIQAEYLSAWFLFSLFLAHLTACIDKMLTFSINTVNKEFFLPVISLSDFDDMLQNKIIHLHERYQAVRTFFWFSFLNNVLLGNFNIIIFYYHICGPQ